MTTEKRVPTLSDLEELADTLDSRLIILEMALAGRERAPRDPDHERRAFADYIAGLSDLAAALRRTVDAGVTRREIEIPRGPL